MTTKVKGVRADIPTSMSTWELNVAEFLQLVVETGVKNVLMSPTPDMVGRVGIVEINLKGEENNPMEIADLVTIIFVAKDGKKVKPKGKKKSRET